MKARFRGQLVQRAPSPRGPRRPLDRHAPGAPFREDNDQGSRPDQWPSPSLRLCTSWGLAAFPRMQRQDASKSLLQPTFTSRALAWSAISGDYPPSAVGNPPAFRIETVFARAFPPLVEDGAGPPCGHPASSSPALDGAAPASGRSASTRALAGWGGKSTAAFSAGGVLPIRTL